jgi:hypothetical protein
LFRRNLPTFLHLHRGVRRRRVACSGGGTAAACPNVRRASYIAPVATAASSLAIAAAAAEAAATTGAGGSRGPSQLSGIARWHCRLSLVGKGETRTAWVRFLPSPTHKTRLCCSAVRGLVKLACPPGLRGGVHVTGSSHHPSGGGGSDRGTAPAFAVAAVTAVRMASPWTHTAAVAAAVIRPSVLRGAGGPAFVAVVAGRDVPFVSSGESESNRQWSVLAASSC